MILEEIDRKALVQYRIEKAQEAFDDAVYMAADSRWNAAGNRLYYSAYYVVSALLLSDEIPVHTHRGLLTQMSLNYVRKGIMTIEEGRLVRQLFNLRHEDDYEDLIDSTEDEIQNFIPQVRKLLDKLIRLNKLYEIE